MKQCKLFNRIMFVLVPIIISFLIMEVFVLGTLHYQRIVFHEFALSTDILDRAMKITNQTKRQNQKNVLGDLIATKSKYKISPYQSQAVAEILMTLCNENISIDLVIALITKESQWNPSAKGLHGEIGLMQLKPTTAKETAQSLFDPVLNVEIGILHLIELFDRFNEIGLSLVAYNAGANANGVRYAEQILKGFQND